MRRILPLLVFFFLSHFSDFCSAQKVGVLYGMTYSGGKFGDGSLFSIDLADSSYSLLNSFLNNADGDGFNPYGNLIQDTDSQLYGMTYNSSQYGTIFKFNILTDSETVLHQFEDIDGAFPHGSLLAVPHGVLYGMVYQGGKNNAGGIFNYNINTSVFYEYFDFTKSSGYQVYGSLIMANNGLLYGMTSNQDSTYGTLFSFNPADSSFIDLIYFAANGSNGSIPHGSLIQASDSNLYGMTLQGGTLDSGVIFRYNINTNTQTVLVSLKDSLGTLPYGSLIQATDGNLYGMTSAGGAFNLGVIFRYNLTTGKDTVLWSFNGTDGANPHGSLIQADDGILYGMTLNGGKYNNGVVFSFNPVTAIEDTILSFNGANGANPYGDLVEAMSATITTKNNVCFGDNGGAATINVRGGHYPLSYKWSNGATTDTDSGLKAGNYAATVVDAKDIAYNFSFTINQPAQLTDSIKQLTNVSCFGGKNGSATISVNGGTKPYSYAWSSSSNTDSVADNLSIGSYTCTVIDSNKCISQIAIAITQPAAPLKDSTSAKTNVNCYGLNTGSAVVGVTGGTPPYSYTWSAGAGSNPAINGLVSGTYTCVIYDSNHCKVADIVTITQPAEIIGVTSYTPTPCSKDSGSVDVSVTGGTPPYTYLWSPTGVTSTLVTGLPAQSYTCAITDSLGCTQTAIVYLPNIDGPKASIITSANVICHGDSTGTATAIVSGGHLPDTSFLWSPYGGTGSTAAKLVAGTYTFSTTDSAGCVGTATVTITQPPQLRDSVSRSINVTCSGGNNGAINVGAVGGTPPYTYLWTPPGIGSGPFINILSAGIYTCTITDKNNCPAYPAQIIETITSPDPLSIDTSATVTKCGKSTGSASIAVVSGGVAPYAYLWSNGLTTTTIANLSGGSYFCKITDSLHCITEAEVTVPDTGGPKETITITHGIRCYGDSTGTLTANVKGTLPYKYQWSSGAGTNYIATNLAAGSYTCVVADATGCFVQDTISIIQPPQIVAAIQVTGICSGSSGGGSATANVSGGVPPYSYPWSSGSTNDSIANAGVGGYLCEITDLNGCIFDTAVKITVAQPMAIVSLTVDSTTCPGCSDGAITVHVTGGIPEGDSLYYFYIWSNGATGDSLINNLDSGWYSVCITSPYGCGTECDSGYVVTGIQALAYSTNCVKIFPNPNNGLLYILLPALGQTELLIYDELGNIVFSQQINAEVSPYTTKVNLANLPDGIYIVRIISGKGAMVKKIDLQK